MNTYISLLRGINVGGNNKILMKDLKDLYAKLNLKDVVTYIQSGNVVFKSNKNEAELKQTIEEGILNTFNLQIEVFIVTPKILMDTIKNCNFIDNPNCEDNKIYFAFTNKEKLDLSVLETFNKENAKFYSFKKVIYLYYPNGAGQTKITNNFIEKKLNLSATSRNLKTVTKLIELSHS